MRLAWAQAGNHDVPVASRRATSRLQDDGTRDVADLQRRYDSATKRFSSMINRDLQLRKDHLNQLQAQLAYRPDKATREELYALRVLQRTEQAQKIFGKIRHTFGPIRSGEAIQPRR